MDFVGKQSVETIIQNISTFIGLQNTSSPVEKQKIAEKVESNANIVGGVCAKDGDADGEKGGVVEGDQAVHDHLQGVVVLVGNFFCFYCIFLTLNVRIEAKLKQLSTVMYLILKASCCYYLARGHPGADGGQDEDVGLPYDGHGNAKHPLDVERADEEEDGEGPVLDAHHDDV